MKQAKKRILVVTGAFPLASETFIREQCLELLENGAEIDVLALRPGDGTWSHRDRAASLEERVIQVDIDRPLVKRLAMAPARLLSVGMHSPRVALRSISPFLGWRATSGQVLEVARSFVPAGRRYDAIHCQFGPMGRIMLPVIDAGILEGPMSVAFYGYDITRELQKHGDEVYRELFDRASILLPNSNYLASRLRAAGAPPEKVRVHRLGIRIHDFPLVDRTGREGAPVALAVGRFVEKKGFEYLIRALAIAGDRCLFRVVLVGDGPLRASLEALAEDLDVRDQIDFVGWLGHHEVAEAMREADLLVAPSVVAADGDMEGMPLVIAEAMSMGLPVVGSRHSGIPEAVWDGENGILVDERDPGGLAGALVELSDQEHRLECGRRSRAIVEKEFNWEIQGARLSGILDSIAG